MAENHSFLPEDYLEKRAQRRTNVISLTLFAIVFAGLSAAWYISHQQRATMRRELMMVDAQFEEAARQLDQLEKLQARREQMIHKAQVTASLIERVPRSVLLAELINSMPGNLTLLELKVDTKTVNRTPAPSTAMERAKVTSKSKTAKAAPPKPQAPETEVQITMTGVAPTDVQVAQFMSALGSNTMFANQHLGFSEETKLKSMSMRKFRVDIQLAPDADAQQHEPRFVKRESIPNPMSDKMKISPDQVFTNHDASQLRSDVMPGRD